MKPYSVLHTCCGLAPTNGGRPVSIAYKTAPSEYRSLAAVSEPASIDRLILNSPEQVLAPTVCHHCFQASSSPWICDHSFEADR